MDFRGTRKRGSLETGLNGNNDYKKFKPEVDSLLTGTGNKLKPSTKFFSKCHFAHGECELGQPTAKISASRKEAPLPSHGLAASFGASSIAKINIDASLAGAIIGKNGVNIKQICCVTGAKLSIRDHQFEPNLRNIELEGTFDQIKKANAIVSELISNIDSTSGNPMKNHGMGHSALASNFKMKLCENFTKGSFTFGEKCHFAHGAEELRKPGI
ncbi:hypothetical protein UlMin_043577 [Ulmus minor]